MSTSWSTDDARNTYAIANWGEGYFDVGADGGVLVRPRGPEGPDLQLPAVVAAARAPGGLPSACSRQAMIRPAPMAVGMSGTSPKTR